MIRHLKIMGKRCEKGKKRTMYKIKINKIDRSKDKADSYDCRKIPQKRKTKLKQE